MLSYLSYPPTRNNRGILKHVQSLPPRHQHRLSVHSVQQWLESDNYGRLAFSSADRILCANQFIHRQPGVRLGARFWPCGRRVSEYAT